MVLLRRVIGDALRARRQAQHRTLREVSTAANVSLGYLSEIERGQKEASSELLGAICDALGAQLSDLLRDVSHTVAAEEQVEMAGVLTPVREMTGMQAMRPVPVPQLRPRRDTTGPDREIAEQVSDGQVSVTVRRDSPLKTTLLATRRRDRGCDVARAA